MYFQDGLSQQEIADALGTTRSNVSRILTSAREQGIVEIRIVEPIQRAHELEDQLVNRFGLGGARVLARQPRQETLADTGRLAAEWLSDRLAPKQRIALSWGGTLQAMVHAVPAQVVRDVEIVQLVGGLSALTLHVSGQELVRELANRLDCSYRYLHAPALFESAQALRALLQEPAIATALDVARSADIACVGIGAYGFGSSAEVVEALRLTAKERKQLEAAHPVGDICARLFDANGEAITAPVQHRVLAVDLDDVRAIPTVLGVAVGAVKARAISAALHADLLDVLVCDETAARATLEVATPAR